MSFILVLSSGPHIAELLKEAVPEFAVAEEYRLHRGEMDDLPGVILCSFARFLARVSRTQPSSIALTKGVEVVGKLWQRQDSKELIEDEFFEELACDLPAASVIVPMMEPTLRAGYSRWSDKQS